eukprot:NODE_2490_length_559_cov_73.099537_g2440_i0.p1 GENE.NODE_2490_length_559_cov_73.099537_g2440_i0~~NODE_2490_length_559_cov_73.099537_g2440_i0.p1  ORF type:complete len:145 (-),score=38.80 NODE_2490_length_559_cov_73.099537_g2440_i0:47-481(-)
MTITDEEAREAFNLFDKKGDGTILATDVGDVLRAVGQNPFESDIKEMIEPYAKAKYVTFEQYLKIQNRKDGFKPHGNEEEFIQAFKVFDHDGNGLISAGELRYVLTNLGERLTDRQVDELIRVVEQDKDGSLYYADFVKAILAG